MNGRTTIQLSENLRKELRILASKRDLSYQELLQDMISIFQELDKEKTIISIPNLLAMKIKEQIKTTDFDSVSEFTTHLLRNILAETIGKQGVTKEDEEKVKEKLRGLGYLD